VILCAVEESFEVTLPSEGGFRPHCREDLRQAQTAQKSARQGV
jgi:hypothetical protein